MQDDGGARNTGQGRRTARGGTASLAISLAMAGSVVLQAQAARAATYTFTNVKVVGTQAVAPATVVRDAAIPRGTPVSDSDLNQAYQRIANTGLFQTVTLTPQGATLVIEVKEYPTVNVINFEGNQRIKGEDLAKIIKSKSRYVYSAAQAEADAQTITEAYRQSKRYDVIVTPQIIPRSQNRVDLVFKIDEGYTVEVQRISFIGNHDFSDYRLRQVLSTQQAGLLHFLFRNNTYDPNRIAEDKKQLTDFYKARGYLDFRVLDVSAQLDRQRNAFFMTFTISEGQKYSFGKTSVTTTLPGMNLKPLEARVDISAGRDYSATAVDAAVTRMENEAVREGLNFIRVTPKITRNDRNQTVDVDFAVDRGPKIFIQRIDIQGNSTTQDAVIRRQFDAAEGDPLNPRALKAAEARIKALGFFKSVQVTTKPGTAPDQAIVDVNVVEQPTGTLSLGGTYSVNDGFGVAISFSEGNFLGTGDHVSASINTTGTNRNSTISFTNPALYGRNVALSFNAQYTTIKHSYANYDLTNIGLSPAITFPVGRLSRLELRYSLARKAVTNIDTTASTIIKSERKTSTPSALGYTYSFNSNQDGLSPDTFYRLQFGQDLAGFGGSTRYVSTTALASAETKLARQAVTLRATVEGGVMTPLGGQDNSVADRYFLNDKIIGFSPNGVGPRDLTVPGQDALGGNYYAAARFEAAFPLGLPANYGISGGVFFNMGSVWGLKNTYGVNVDDSFHLRSAIGFTIYWDTAIGPLRFDFSRPVQKMSYDRVQNFNFSIATRF